MKITIHRGGFNKQPFPVSRASNIYPDAAIGYVWWELLHKKHDLLDDEDRKRMYLKSVDAILEIANAGLQGRPKIPKATWVQSTLKIKNMPAEILVIAPSNETPEATGMKDRI